MYSLKNELLIFLPKSRLQRFVFPFFCTLNTSFSSLNLINLNNYFLRIFCCNWKKNLWRKHVVFEKKIILQFFHLNQDVTFLVLQRLIFQIWCLRTQRTLFCASFGGNQKKITSYVGIMYFLKKKNIFFIFYPYRDSKP